MNILLDLVSLLLIINESKEKNLSKTIMLGVIKGYVSKLQWMNVQ